MAEPLTPSSGLLGQDVDPIIIVLDGETRAALATVRSLGRRGWAVHVGASVPRSIAGGSRFASSETLLPEALDDAATYAAAVAQLVAVRHATLLLPMTEASTLALLEQRSQLPDVRIPIPSLGTFRKASDKSAMLALAAELGLDVPEQWTLTGNPGEPIDIPIDRYPVVVKPARSVVGRDGARRKVGVSYADSPAQLRQRLESQGPASGPYLVQVRVRGPGVGVFLLRWKGEFLAAFGHRRIREKPPSGGVSVLCESIAVPPALLAQSESLLGSLDWDGVAMVEYKRDTRTGRMFLMEVNPRFWGSLQLAIDSGVDFPALLVEAALGGSPKPVTQWRLGVRSRWGWGDVDHFLIRLMHSKDSWMLPPEAPGLLGTALSVLFPWRPHQRSDVFRLHDPRPWIRETTAWFRGLLT